MAFESGPYRSSKISSSKPFGPMAPLQPPLSLSFPANIGRDGFRIGTLSVLKISSSKPFGPIAPLQPPLGLSFPADIGRDGFRIGTISNLKKISRAGGHQIPHPEGLRPPEVLPKNPVLKSPLFWHHSRCLCPPRKYFQNCRSTSGVGSTSRGLEVLPVSFAFQLACPDF